MTAETTLPPCLIEPPPIGSASPDCAESLGRPLTARQLEVLQLAARGFTNKGIGKELGLSQQTVKNHLGQIFKRTGTQSRAHAIARLFGCYENNCPIRNKERCCNHLPMRGSRST